MKWKKKSKKMKNAQGTSVISYLKTVLISWETTVLLDKRLELKDGGWKRLTDFSL